MSTAQFFKYKIVHLHNKHKKQSTKNNDKDYIARINS